MNIQVLKAALPFPDLVRITHAIPRSNKLLCPYHQENTASYHVYSDHGFCFACHSYDDHISWLEHQRGFSTHDAIRYLRQLTGGIPLLKSTASLPKENHHQPKSCQAKAITQEQWQNHKARVLNLNKIPKALENRGFTLSDLKHLHIAATGESAILPIFDPQGNLIALKKRHFNPNPHRYSYITKNHGTPAWCSPKLNRKKRILIIEGELNAMIAYCALAEIGIMGTAGSSGHLHLNILKNKIIYIYADGDKAGLRAQQNWARDAHYSQAKSIHLVKPWFMDACELAGLHGKEPLRKRLLQSLEEAEPYALPRNTRASPLCPKQPFDAHSLNQKIPRLEQYLRI